MPPTCLLSTKLQLKLPDLPYDYGALEPVIIGEIMELHHKKHHQAKRGPGSVAPFPFLPLTASATFCRRSAPKPHPYRMV